MCLICGFYLDRAFCLRCMAVMLLDFERQLDGHPALPLHELRKLAQKDQATGEQLLFWARILNFETEEEE